MSKKTKKTKKSKATKTMREQGRYVLVVHMTVAQHKKMDSRKGKLSRSEWARKRLGL